MAMQTSTPIRLGVSACLLGEAVRFNGGHCRNRFLLDEASRFAELVPVCPEVGVGLGTPRESLRLVRRNGLVRLEAPRSGTDHTDAMTRWSRERVEGLRRAGLSGFVLKKDSPSCGMERVKAYDENQVPSRSETGLFAAELMRAMPLLPVEEEGRLNDPGLRENFFERVFAHARLRGFFSGDWDVAGLVRFHTAEKLLLLSHDPARQERLGRLVAEAKRLDRDEVAAEYQRLFMEALSRRASVRRQCHTLQRVIRYFRNRLDATAIAEVETLVDDFRRGLTPLATPLALIRHYVRRFGVDYVATQTYLDPHPKELRLRSVM